MTQIKVDTIADAAGTGAADFADGITIAGGALSALNTAEYYSSASEPTSPKNGAIWWDTTNEKVMVYIAGEFKEVELGAGGAVSWTVDLADVTYISKAAINQDGQMQGLSFSADGTKMYTSGVGSDYIYQYSLSTAFDISTVSYNNVSLSIGSQESTPRGIFTSQDGTKIYIVGSSSDAVQEYSLSTAFDLSTASHSTSFSVSGQTNNPYGIYISADGEKMYISEYNSSVHQYTLSTAWDLSTASYDNKNLNVGVISLMGVFLNPEGTKLYVMSQSTDVIYQYTLSTAFDVSTGVADSSTFSLGSSDWGDIYFSADGTKMFALEYSATDEVYQYSTGL